MRQRKLHKSLFLASLFERGLYHLCYTVHFNELVNVSLPYNGVEFKILPNFCARSVIIKTNTSYEAVKQLIMASNYQVIHPALFINRSLLDQFIDRYN